MFFLSLRKVKQQTRGTYVREKEVDRPQHEEDKWMVNIDPNRAKTVATPASKTLSGVFNKSVCRRVLNTY